MALTNELEDLRALLEEALTAEHAAIAQCAAVVKERDLAQEEQATSEEHSLKEFNRISALHAASEARCADLEKERDGGRICYCPDVAWAGYCPKHSAEQFDRLLRDNASLRSSLALAQAGAAQMRAALQAVAWHVAQNPGALPVPEATLVLRGFSSDAGREFLAAFDGMRETLTKAKYYTKNDLDAQDMDARIVAALANAAKVRGGGA